MTASAVEERLARARQRQQARKNDTDAERQGATEAVIAPRPAGTMPLSGTQRGIWFVAQARGATDPFALPLAVRLQGPVDERRLLDACRAIVTRHEVLRTRVVERDGEPVAVLDPEPAPAITVTDADPEDWQQLAGRAALARFDLAVEQPWRVSLLRLAPEDVVLVFTVHHIACDGWSLAVLRDELSRLYRGEQLSPLPVQCADVAYHRQHQGADAGDVEYWVEHLDAAPAQLALPTDRPRSAAGVATANELAHPLSEPAADALRTLMSTSSCTAFMVLLAGWHVVLSRWANTRDIVIGTAVAGRDHPSLAGLVGCFVNTLALRTRSAPDETVRELLARAQRVTADGLAHRAIGLDRVAAALQPRRAGSTPLYDVSLVVHTEPQLPLELPDTTVTEVELAGAYGQQDLSISAAGPLTTGQPGGLTFTVQYLSALYDAATISRLLGHLEQVLVDMAVDVDGRLADLRMLCDAEWQALRELSGSDVAAQEPAPCRVEELVWQWARRTPDTVAVSSGGVEMTYRQLHSASCRVAGRLRAAGVRPGDRVGVLVDRSVDVFAAMFGVLTAGAAYLPVDPAHPDARIRAVLTQAGVTAVVTQPELASRPPDGMAVVLVSAADWTEPEPDPDSFPGIEDGPDSLAYVLFTSGTTGTPKGVAVEHGHLLSYLAGARRVHGFDDGWSWAMMTTPAADLGLTTVLGALTTGGRLHLLSYAEVTDPQQVAAYLRRHPIDAMKLVPSQLQALWDDADPTAVLPSRLLILAGEALPWELVDSIREVAPELVVHNSYGPSETTVATLFAEPDRLTARGSTSAVPIGRPFPGSRAYVLDRDGRPVPVGVPGELVVAGPSIARGYLDAGPETAQSFVAEPNLPGSRGGRAYRTGDLARWLPSGDVEFLGRIDDQVKIRGYRVEPGEIARAAANLPEVADCAVILREDGGRRRLVAYLVAVGDDADIGAGADLAQTVRARLRERLPDYLVPAEYVTVPKIPLGPNGKLDRAALPAPSTTRGHSEGSASLAGATEHQVAAAWCSVLGLDAVGALEDFFDVGGDSFATVKLVRAINGAASVTDVFANPTVRSLAACIDARASGQTAPSGLLHRLSKPGPRADQDCVHLVCVPFGGGTPVAFVPLAEALGSDYVVHGVGLPGHDISRPDEPAAPIADVAAALVAEVSALPGKVVLLGHCLGGALAMQTALQLEAAGRPVLGVVESGTFPAARIPGRISEWVYRVLPGDRMMSDRAYLEWLRALGGFDDDADPAEQQQLVTALRHDNREAETYYTKRYAALDSGHAPRRLVAPMLCVVGERDRATELYAERFEEWRGFSEDVDLAVIPGAGHFYTRHQPAEFAAAIDERARRWVAGERPSTVPVTAGASPASTRTFLLVAVTQLLSMIGTGLTSFALGVWVLQQTGSVTKFATIEAMAVLPMIFALPFAGAAADRFDRRKIMLAADTVAGAMTALLVTQIALGRLELWYIYLFAAVGSLANAFQRPAYLAAITQLVPKRYLGQANGLVSLGTSSGDLIAAVAGGTLLGLFGLSGVVAVDVATFVIGVSVIAVVRFPNRLFVRREEGFVAEILGGWRYTLARRELIAMVLFFSVFNYLFTFPLTLAQPIVLANHDARTLGIVLGCGGLGAVAGAVLMAIWGGTRRRARGMIGGTAVLGACALTIGLTPEPVLIALGLFGMYACLLVTNAHWLALIQTKVGLELQGRVLAANQMIATAMMPLGFLSVGPISSWIGRRYADQGGALHWVGGLFGPEGGRGYGLTLVLVGVVLAGWGALGLRYRPLRDMDTTLPDALPDAVVPGNKDALQLAADEQLRKARAARRGCEKVSAR